MNPKSKNFTVAGPPVIPGLTRKETWDRLIATRQSVRKEEVSQRIKEAAAKKQ